MGPEPRDGGRGSLVCRRYAQAFGEQTVIWVKTEAGALELKSHALIRQAPTQNLLRSIDGVKSEELLLKYSPGVTPEDFRLLHRLRLIEPVAPLPSTGATAQPTIRSGPQKVAAPARDPSIAPHTRQFSLVLSRLVSTHLGFAGMALTSAIVRAESTEQLRELARRLLVDIERREGHRAAESAAHELRPYM